jgi:sulfatase modifying factor 1
MGSPAGVGDEDEHPAHDVTLPRYCIDLTEVTVKAYEMCVAAGGCPAAMRTVQSSGYSADDVKRWSRFCNGDERPDHPINCVDWKQATAYCAWTGGRLPTEAEWEFAARGNDGRQYPWGDDAPSAHRLNACGSECAAMLASKVNLDWTPMYAARDDWETTAPVGRFPDGASPFGALDMAGNLFEWTADRYGPYKATDGPNPLGSESDDARVVRGGSWYDFDPGVVRAAARDSYEPTRRNVTLGFRCVRAD